MATRGDVVRVAAVGDLHCKTTSQGSLQALFAATAAQADVLALCGDMTDSGLPEEAEVLAHEISAAGRVPIVAVLGNHDVESGEEAALKRILGHAGVEVLDGQASTIRGIGFVGVKGFAGGFGEHALGPWGEESIKRFVREALDEALKLESALARVRTAQRIVLLHYSPVRSTVEGEAREIFPFLGSSRLEEPLNRYPVTAVFHGHAHGGQLEGRTASGVPVYNVAIPVLARAFPDRPPFRVVEIANGGTE